jgi:cell division protein FtsL
MLKKHKARVKKIKDFAKKDKVFIILVIVIIVFVGINTFEVVKTSPLESDTPEEIINVDETGNEEKVI